MPEWYLVLAVFWGFFLLDGIRRGKHPRFAVSGCAPWPGTARHDSVHVLPPAPWAWRFWADDPPFALSPEGLCNQPVGSAGRPAARPRFLRTRRWEDIRSVASRDGWLWINDERFAAAAEAFPAAELERLAATLVPLDAAARAARLRRQFALWFRPAHWRRRLAFARRLTVWPAAANAVTLLSAAVASAAALPVFPKAVAERLLEHAPRFVLIAFAAYVAGIAAAFWAARRLRRWTSPGLTKRMLSAALFPPQALRWRALLTEACRPAPHPLLAVLATGGPAARRESCFFALADLRWPVPLPQSAPQESALAGAVRAWHAAEFEKRLERWMNRHKLDTNGLLAAPRRDSSASCAYCPRCKEQFARSDGTCPRGIPLLPLP